jgi:hydrogenase expression/formation protein HypC
MCLAIPARVTAVLDETRAVVDLGGIRKEISTALVEDVRVGEYVILHVGFALGRLDEAEAERTLALMEEAGVLEAEQ